MSFWDHVQYMNEAIFTDGRGMVMSNTLGVAPPLTMERLQEYAAELERRRDEPPAPAMHAGYEFRLDPDCPTGVIYFVRRSAAELESEYPTISGEPGSRIGHIYYDYGADPVPAAAQDHIDTLLDLARTHREQDFRDLALMVGVEREQIDALWDGTVKRLKA